jgi:hypothetical protein
MNDFAVKFPGRLRSPIEQIASEQFLPVPDLVRSMVQKAIFQHQLERGRKQGPK